MKKLKNLRKLGMLGMLLGLAFTGYSQSTLADPTSVGVTGQPGAVNAQSLQATEGTQSVGVQVAPGQPVSEALLSAKNGGKVSAQSNVGANQGSSLTQSVQSGNATLGTATAQTVTGTRLNGSVGSDGVSTPVQENGTSATVAGSTMTYNQAAPMGDFTESPTNKVIVMSFAGLDKSKAGQIEALAKAAGYRAVTVDYATGTVKVAGNPEIVKLENVKVWVKQNLVTTPSTH